MNSRLFKERGQALILIALGAIGLFAIAGLAIDGSIKYSDRRHAQNAADTAALAGALAKSKNPPDPLWNIVALDRALANGYDDNHVTNEVEVYSPPISGYYAGNPSYVQVIITSYIDTYFARVIGINRTVNAVQAVALAEQPKVLGDGAMIISYDPDPNCSTGGTGGYSVQVNGSSTMNLNGGGIFLNSHDVCGFKIPNCADLNIYGGAGINTVGASNIDTTGCTFDPPIIPKYNQEPIDIPAEVSWPPVPPECSMGSYPTPKYMGSVMAGSPPKMTEEWLIYPGYYETFPPASPVAKKSHIYMASGVYCIDPGGPAWDGDLSWSAVDSARLNGSVDPITNKYQAENPTGVTLYIRSGGGFALNSNNPTFLDATTSSTSDYQGYLIIVEGTQTSIESCSITGGADLDINGMIFAPYCDITVNGSSSSTAVINAQLIGWDIKINGGAGINFNYDPSNAVKIKRKVGLMK